MITIEKALSQLNPDSILSVYKNKYNNMDSDDLNNLVLTGQKISKYIIKNPGKISLILGQVQSGKTATYLSIIANLFDMGSNFIFVTPSIDNILLKQTYSRIMNTFDCGSVKVFLLNDLFIGNKVDVSKIYNALKSGDKIILLSLKQKLRLEQTLQVLSLIKNKIKYPVIIDDEGDQASFNNKIDDVESKIYKCIRNIYNSSPQMSMLTVTASPMPHIFVNNEYEMKPDKAFYTPPGKDYIGIEQFMDETNNFIEAVPAEDNSIILREKAGALPKSFRKSILSFIIAAAIAHLRNENYEVQSMLLHIDRKIERHTLIKRISENYISNTLLRKLSFPDDKMKDEILAILKSFKIEDIDHEELIPLLLSHLKNTEVVVINGKLENREEINKLHNPLKRNYIYIGSSMLQRGITIPNLLHTYFTYRGTGTLNADTVLQRARWFGYRKNKDLIKLFLSKIAIDDFRALSSTVPDIIERIKYIEDEDLDFAEMERSILIPYANMKATRDSVQKNRRSKLSRYIADYTISNSETGEDLFNRISEIKNPVKMIAGQPFYGIKLDDYFDFNDWLSKEIVTKIYSELIPNKNDVKAFEDFIKMENPVFFIANMITEKIYRERSVGENNTISLTQGRGDANKGYVGDRYWYDDNSGKFKNALILQLFKIKLDNGKIIYKMALVATKRIHGHLIHSVDEQI